MIKSHVLECTSFTQTQCDIKLPKSLCSSMKLAHLGVFGGVGYPVSGIAGQLGVISEIELLDGGTVLSGYTNKVQNLLEFLVLRKSNNVNRNVLKSLHCSNYGFLLNNGGADAGETLDGIASTPYEGAVRPRVCVDKKNLMTSQVLEQETDFAVLDLSMVLGFLNAQYKMGENVMQNVIPCNLFENLRLRIKFNSPASVCDNATTVAQPYLIFDEIIDEQLSNAFLQSKNSIIAQYKDLELEQVFLGANTSVNTFLNGFYGKTIGNLYVMFDSSTSGSPYQGGARGNGIPPKEQFKFTVNNNSLLSLTSGIDHVGKKAMYLRQCGLDLDVPSLGDRVITLNGNLATIANGDANCLYEGGGSDKSVESNFYNAGRLSYLALPLDIKIDSMQVEYLRTLTGVVNMLVWAELGKFLNFDKNSGATTISYL